MSDNTQTTLGQTIHAIRDTAGLTLREVADQSGLSVSYLSDIERGRTEPSLHALRQIAQGLGVSVGDIFQADAHDLTPREWKLIYAWRANDWRTIAFMLTLMGDGS